MNQETDAMQVMSIDRFDALVVPRVLAAILMMPLLTFFADIGGILGGLLVSWVTIDLNPLFFVQRTLETVSINHFWIGMSKAPFLRSEEHTSELQSLMRISYAVFCLKKKKQLLIKMHSTNMIKIMKAL